MQIDTTFFWFGLSMVLFLVEAFGLPGLGFFFAAIAALCVGLLVELNVLALDDHIQQGSAFFALTAIWAAALWKPLKKWRMQNPAQVHNDMIGRTAIVAEGGLSKNRSGNAKWSGTIMKARMAADAAIEKAAEGDELKIVDVQSATLILAELSYVLPARP